MSATQSTPRTPHLRAALLVVCLLGITLGGSNLALAQPTVPGTKAPASASAAASSPQARAIFAGGCFWCVESDFDKIPGVLSTTSGYTGGRTANPTYEQVSSKSTGHAEVVEVIYDPSKVSYTRLVEYFWHTIDPTVKDQQFCDKGSPYRSAIFAVDAEQLQIAQASKAALEKTKPFKEPIVTEIVIAGTFYPAEDYHQDYYRNNPLRYKYYRNGCGRDARLQSLWGPLAGK